jgi:ABC-type glycerol-3-phosphate transport system permease component
MNRKRWETVAMTSVVGVIALVAAFPFLVMLVLATQDTESLFRGLALRPGGFLLRNLRTVIQGGFLRFYANSGFVSVIATIVSVFVSALAGYGLAMYRFRMRRFAVAFVLATMMIPPHIGMVAYVVQMRVLGLTNSLWPLIFWWTAHGFGVFLMMQFVGAAVPKAVVESARIDGCNEFRIFRSLALPLVQPALVTLIMIVFVLSWNNYLLPLVLINNVDTYTVPLGVATLGGFYRADYTAAVAGLALGTVPVLVVFLFGSRAFIRGITAGAVKE